MSRSAEVAAEAESLCPLIKKHAEPLKNATLGKAFRLDDAFFRLHAKDRNTIYRVSGRFDWFLKLCRSTDVGAIARERYGAHTIGKVLGHRADYGGASIIRVATDPAYVLAAAIPGKSLSRVFLTESWFPGSAVMARLEDAFGTLGKLLATLHAEAPVAEDAPQPSKRPFEALKKRLDGVTSSDAITDEIAAWYDLHRRSDDGGTFVHGHMRLDNVLQIGARLGFVDFEHCGRGSFYQDLSRPVSQMLTTHGAVAFPRERVHRCIKSFLDRYREIHPYENAQLDDYVGLRLAQYYLVSRKAGLRPSRVGGLPVLRTKLNRLVLAVLRNGLQGVIPDMSRSC